MLLVDNNKAAKQHMAITFFKKPKVRKKIGNCEILTCSQAQDRTGI